jgi:hypothetical protein
MKKKSKNKMLEQLKYLLLILAAVVTVGLLTTAGCGGTRTRTAHMDFTASDVNAEIDKLVLAAEDASVSDNTRNAVRRFADLRAEPGATTFAAQAPDKGMGPIEIVLPLKLNMLASSGASIGALSYLASYFVISHREDGPRAGLLIKGTDGNGDFWLVAVNDGKDGEDPGHYTDEDFAIQMKIFKAQPSEDKTILLQTTDLASDTEDLAEVIKMKVGVENGSEAFQSVGWMHVAVPLE